MFWVWGFQKKSLFWGHGGSGDIFGSRVISTRGTWEIFSNTQQAASISLFWVCLNGRYFGGMPDILDSVGGSCQPIFVWDTL